MNVQELEIREEKLKRLEDILRGYGSVAVAFSGGVDSTFLLAVAHEVLGESCIAMTADSPSFPDREHNEAAQFCRDRGIRQVFFESEEMDDEDYVKNPRNRCYYCKQALFAGMKKLAKQYGVQVIVEGSNMDDMGDYRPGLDAVDELGIASPLRGAGLGKEEIRELSREMDLPTWDKPAFACLASRIPYGESITEEKLSRVERAEDVLRVAGLKQLRVRVHEDLARIEVLPEEFDTVMDKRVAIVAGVRAAGFTYVALDLEGYTQGKMNRKIGKAK